MIIHKDIEQGTEEWFRLRLAIPTASVADKIVTSTGKPSTSIRKLAMSLAADLWANEELERWEGNDATARGHELEPEARNWYELEHPDQDPVEQVAFITNDQKTWGCSPDGLVGKEGMLEIKCLKKLGHSEALEYYMKHDKPPTKYVPQCQMQMYVALRDWCDIYYYHPVLPSFTIRQYPDMEIFQQLDQLLPKVIEQRNEVFEHYQEMDERT